MKTWNSHITTEEDKVVRKYLDTGIFSFVQIALMSTEFLLRVENERVWFRCAYDEQRKRWERIEFEPALNTDDILNLLNPQAADKVLFHLDLFR